MNGRTCRVDPRYNVYTRELRLALTFLFLLIGFRESTAAAAAAECTLHLEISRRVFVLPCRPTRSPSPYRASRGKSTDLFKRPSQRDEPSDKSRSNAFRFSYRFLFRPLSRPFAHANADLFLHPPSASRDRGFFFPFPRNDSSLFPFR